MKDSQNAKKTRNVIEVKLGTDPLTLAVLDHNVERNAVNQTIVWQLDKSLEDGNFIAFQWTDPLLAVKAFGKPEISFDGNSLTVTDINDDSTPKGGFAYIVNVELGGKTYTSRTNSPIKIPKDPVIVNK